MPSEVDPSPARPSPWQRLAPFAGLGVSVAVVAFLLGRALPFAPSASSDNGVITIRPSPNVIVAMRDLARLETTDYHVERVIELADEQERLFGLVHARDALLLVAAGDVVAGIDLTKLADADIDVDWPNHQARVRLPDPEIFSVAIDNARTHVVTRTTDTLATRNEALEGSARSEAESSMRAAAVEAGVLSRAKVGGERAVGEVLRGLGFTSVTFDGGTGRTDERPLLRSPADAAQ